MLAWEYDSRDRATLEKLSVRHYALNVGIYYAAKWKPVCESLFPASKWVQTRAEMPRNERNNSRMRHGFGRFKRKSMIVSIVKLIIIYTLHWRNGGLHTPPAKEAHPLTKRMSTYFQILL